MHATPPMDNLQDFDQFIQDHAHRPGSWWNKERVRVLAKACEDRLASEGGWKPGEMVVRAFSPALSAGFSLPPTLAGLLLASGHGKALRRWGLKFPDSVPSLAQAASQALPSHDYDGESPDWTTALHRLAGATPSLPHYQQSLEIALKEGADPRILDSQGKSPLFAARKLTAARALLKSDAPLGIDSRAQHSLSRAMASFLTASDPERKEFVQAIVRSVRPQDRPGVIFAAAAKGYDLLLEPLLASWKLAQQDVEKMTVQMPGPSGTIQWSWPGWLAYHGILGLRETPFVRLSQSVRKMVHGSLPMGDDWNRMWVVVATHHAFFGRTQALGSKSLRGAISTHKESLDSHAFRHRVQQRPDLPLDRGGLIRYRALRAWLMAGLRHDLENPNPPAGSWKLAERFLLEDIQAQERMPAKDYKDVQEIVLSSALRTHPGGPDAPSWGAVALALARAFDRVSRGGEFPSWLQVKIRRLDRPFGAWFDPAREQAQTDPQTMDGVMEAVGSLEIENAEEWDTVFSKTPNGAKWEDLFHRMASECLARQMSRQLPSVPVPSRPGSRSRF